MKEFINLRPFLHLILLHGRAAYPMLAGTLPAAIQALSNPFLFDRCPVSATVQGHILCAPLCESAHLG